jgi:hypothetical protein
MIRNVRINWFNDQDREYLSQLKRRTQKIWRCYILPTWDFMLTLIVVIISWTLIVATAWFLFKILSLTIKLLNSL